MGAWCLLIRRPLSLVWLVSCSDTRTILMDLTALKWSLMALGSQMISVGVQAPPLQFPLFQEKDNRPHHGAVCRD